MRIRLAPGLAATLALLAATAFTQQLPLKQELERLVQGPMRIDKVKDGLYVIRGPFNACTTRGCTPNGPDDGLIHEPGDVAVRVTPDGVILVDDKYPENVAEVLQHVKRITSQPIRYMLNSHHHGDHVSGNVNVRQALGIDIIAHRNIRENVVRIKQPGEPNIVFADQASVFLGGVEVRLLWLGRGHTNGDTVTYFPDLRAVHMGDLVIDGAPVVDYQGGGSAIEFVKTLDNMLTLDFDVAIPGHGRVMTKDEVRAYRIRFDTMNQRMREIVRRKVPKGQAVAALKLEDFGWVNTVSSSNFDRRIGDYYDEVAALR